jgi:hypothetical protein
MMRELLAYVLDRMFKIGCLITTVQVVAIGLSSLLFGNEIYMDGTQMLALIAVGFGSSLPMLMYFFWDYGAVDMKSRILFRTVHFLLTGGIVIGLYRVFLPGAETIARNFVIVYLLIVAVQSYQDRKLANRLNKRLKNL